MKADVEKLPIPDKELKKITGIRDFKRLISEADIQYLSGKEPRTYLPVPSDVVIRPSVIHALLHDSEWRQRFLTKLANNIAAKKHRVFGWVSTGILMPVLLVILSRVFGVDEIALIAIVLVGTPLMYVVLRLFSKHALFRPAEDAVRHTVLEYMETLTPTHLGALLDEVDHYNHTIQKLTSYFDAIDQLANAGNPVQIQDREKTIGAFQGMRADLIRALKTERVFRENPHLQPEQFSIDFVPLKTLEFDEQAKDFERLVNETIEIGSKVQEEMKNLSKIPY
jgi:hypothetical protein